MTPAAVEPGILKPHFQDRLDALKATLGTAVTLRQFVDVTPPDLRFRSDLLQFLVERLARPAPVDSKP
jgi:hypothetical protein